MSDQYAAYLDKLARQGRSILTVMELTDPEREDWNHAVEACEAGAAALRDQGWRPIDSAPKDGTQFLVLWQQSLMGGAPHADMVSGWREYQEILAFGEPPATHWCPIPSPPLSPARET